MNIRKAFRAGSEVVSFKYFADVANFIKFDPLDLVITSKTIYEKYLSKYIKDCRVILRDNYGRSTNTDSIVEKVVKDAGANYARVIGIGGGSILDLAKLMALEKVSPVNLIYHQRIEIKKIRDLVLVPCTPGTGSEVTPYCAILMENLGIQMVLHDDNLYADKAILCPELLEDLPFRVFAASSFDAFVHAFESYLSPLATTISKTLSMEAMRIIIKSWISISSNGVSAIADNVQNIQEAASMAGIGYANAGCATIHAMSYPLCVRLHIPHGEANYLAFFEIVKLYNEKKPQGSIMEIKDNLALVLNCKTDEVFLELEKLCGNILTRKKLGTYGMKENQVLEFTDMVLTRQHMLIANGYVQLTLGEIADIYKNLI